MHNIFTRSYYKNFHYGIWSHLMLIGVQFTLNINIWREFDWLAYPCNLCYQINYKMRPNNVTIFFFSKNLKNLSFSSSYMKYNENVSMCGIPGIVMSLKQYASAVKKMYESQTSERSPNWLEKIQIHIHKILASLVWTTTKKKSYYKWYCESLFHGMHSFIWHGVRHTTTYHLLDVNSNKTHSNMYTIPIHNCIRVYEPLWPPPPMNH